MNGSKKYEAVKFNYEINILSVNFANAKFAHYKICEYQDYDFTLMSID